MKIFEKRNSVNEAAKKIGCHKNTVYQLIFREKLTYTRIGNRYKISDQSITDYLASNSRSAKS